MFSPKTRILVVDDMMTMRKVIGNALEVLGYNTYLEAANGVEAFALLQNAEKPIDLILSDWNMPQMGGLDLLKKIKADEKLRDIPFVVITSVEEINQITAAILNGAAGYITKPFTPEVLQKQLKYVYEGLFS